MEHTDTTTYPDPFTDTATYIFHVGPIAELEVRDGAPNPELPPGQTAFTVEAVNNGPDATHNAEVTVSLPTGVTCDSHTASAGMYNSTTGVWTIGELNHKIVLQSLHRREGEILTIHCTAGAAGETATATIANDNANDPYSVTIDDGDPDTDDVHEGTVFDYIDDNDTADITAAAGALTGPRNLRVTPGESMALTWDAPEGDFRGGPATHYRIDFHNGDGWEMLVGNTESIYPGSRTRCDVAGEECVIETSYTDYRVDEGETRYYRVAGVNQWGRLSAWAYSSALPGAPLNVRAVQEANIDGTLDLFRVTWDPPAGGASGYQAQCQAPPGLADAVTAIVDVAGTEWVHRNRNYDTHPCAYRVRAVRGDLAGPWSEPVSPGDAPMDRKPVFDLTEVNYAWTVGQSIGAARTFSGTPADPGSATLTLTVTDGDATDPDSAELTVNISVTMPSAPPTLTCERLDGEQVRLSWAHPDFTANYQYQIVFAKTSSVVNLRDDSFTPKSGLLTGSSRVSRLNNLPGVFEVIRIRGREQGTTAWGAWSNLCAADGYTPANPNPPPK